MSATVRSRRSFGFAALLPAVALVWLLIPTSEASAGRLLVTGHDWDLHCSFGDQCHYTRVGVNFVRGSSNKRVLVVDQLDGGSYDIDVALDNVYGTDFPRKIVEPTTAAWRNAKLTPRRYSAILIASDDSCGGCDLNQVGTEDSQAINKRKKALKRYFNRGGGIMAGSGAENGDEPGDIFYKFVPLPVGGEEVTSPFCLTNVGIDLGFHDQECPNPARHNGTEDDINCCATHNSFAEPPSGSALKVAERDAKNFAETLIARGKIRGGGFVQDMRLTVSPKQVPEDTKNCFKLRVRSEGDPLRNATVKFGGKKKKTNRRGRATICVTFPDPGKQRAKATKRGFGSDTAGVRVEPRGGLPCPGRTAARC